MRIMIEQMEKEKEESDVTLHSLGTNLNKFSQLTGSNQQLVQQDANGRLRSPKPQVVREIVIDALKLKDEKTELESTVKQLSEEIAQLRKTIVSLKRTETDVESLKRELEELNPLLLERQKEIDSLKIKLAAAEKEVRTSRDNYANLQDRLRDVQFELAKAQKTIGHITISHMTVKKDVRPNVTVAQHHQLQHDLVVVTAERDARPTQGILLQYQHQLQQQSQQISRINSLNPAQKSSINRVLGFPLC